jgi:hypothetical protein
MARRRWRRLGRAADGWALRQTDVGSEFKAECANSLHHSCDQHRLARPYKKNEQVFILLTPAPFDMKE